MRASLRCLALVLLTTASPAVAAPMGPVIVGPPDGSRVSLEQPMPMTFTWTAVPGAVQYGFEYTGPGRQFSNANGTEPDGVNGFGGAGGGLLVHDTSLAVVLAAPFPGGTYQVRVIGVSATGQLVGAFSDAVTVVVVGPDSGIDGLVLIGPTAPVCRVGQSCVRPYAATLGVQDPVSGRLLMAVRSGDDGRFRVALAPGQYVLMPIETGLPYPRGGAQSVTVEAGRYTGVTVDFDSGIR